MRLKGHSYDIRVDDNAILDSGDSHTEIQFWCFDPESNPFLLRIRDFPVFCNVELPLLDEYGKRIRWDSDLVDDLAVLMKRVLPEELRPNQVAYKRYKKLFYYSGDLTAPFMLVTFNTIEQMKQCSRVCKKGITHKFFGKLSLVFRETDISVYQKLLSIQDLGPTERFEIEAEEIPYDDYRRTTKQNIKEYIGDWKTMNPDKEATWFSKPMVCSFDIESYSHNHRAFPNKQDPLDVVFSVSVIFWRFQEPIENADCHVIKIGLSKPIDGITIHQVHDESELVDKFCELIIKHDPDIFTGYNIFGFDWDYLDTRLRSEMRSWKNISRLQDYNVEMKNISWKSSAYGVNNLFFIDAPGRISIDMLPYIKRDYKLSMYNLNAVGKYFLGETKVDLKPHEMFESYALSMDMMKILKEKYNTTDDIEVMEKMWKDENLNEKLETAIEGNTKIIEYNNQDSLLVLRLFEKLNVPITLFVLSNVVRTTPMDFFTRGQSNRVTALLYNKASHKGIVLTDRFKDYIHYSGGHVEDPIPGFWELVSCLDFRSLYPSIMIAENICYTTLLKDPKSLPPDQVNTFNITQEEPLYVEAPTEDDFDYGTDHGISGISNLSAEDKKKKVKRDYTFAFVKPEVQKGLLPEILESLLDERKKVKKQMKMYKSQLEKTENIKEIFGLKTQIAICNAKQLGLKISANSVYGFLGFQRNKLSMVEGGMVVTYCGRELIRAASRFFEEKFGATTVYGDSVMGYTPIYTDYYGWTTIENLFKKGRSHKPYVNFKLDGAIRIEKEQCKSDRLIRDSQSRYVKIRRIIRHKTLKNIYRIVTPKGVVDVTEDHSLLLPDGTPIKPKDCKVGTKLLHSPFDDFEASEPENISTKVFDTQIDLAEYKNSAEYECFIDYQDGKYILRPDPPKISCLDEIIHIEKIISGYNGYVYDIETESGMFQAGAGSIVVKNTDSTMVYVPGTTPENCWEVAQKLEREINGTPEKKGIFKPPLYLEFEKVMKALFIKKKKYAYLEYGPDGKIIKEKGSDKDNLNVKGILLARRDNCKWVRDAYENVLRGILNGENMFQIFLKILNPIIDIIGMNVDIAEELTLVNSMGTNYKNKSFPLAIFAEEMKALGKPVKPSERFRYVIVNDFAERQKMGYKMRTLDVFFDSWEPFRKYGAPVPDDYEPEDGLIQPETIDAYYYINNKYREQIDQLFEYGFMKNMKELEQIGYKPRFRRLASVSIQTPVKMIVTIFRDLRIEKDLTPALDILKQLPRVMEKYLKK